MPDLDWSDVRCFLALAREQNFVRAGRMLRLDRSTVSRRVRSLETALATALFDVKSERCFLTAAGENLLPLAEAMERAAADLKRAALSTDAQLDGVVRIALSDVLARCFLLPRLQSLRDDLPGIALELVTGPELGTVVRRAPDIVLRHTPPADPQNVVARRVGSLRWGTYAASGVEFLTAPLVDFHEEASGNLGARWLATHLPARPRRVRCNGVLAAGAACAAGWGVAALPAVVAAQYPDLRRGPDEVGMAPIFLVTPEGSRASARVRAVADHLEAVFESARSELEG